MNKPFALKKEAVIKALGGEEATREFFDVTRQAIWLWGEHIPKDRANELYRRRKDIVDSITGKYK
jgi:hypothetical protein